MASSPSPAVVPEVPAHPSRNRNGLLTSAVAAAVSVFWFAGGRDDWSQAGFLHLAFARSLAEQHVFGVPGRAVYGDGSPLWVLLLAATHTVLRPVSLDWVTAGKALTALTAVFLATGVYGFARTLGAPAGAASGRPASTGQISEDQVSEGQVSEGQVSRGQVSRGQISKSQVSKSQDVTGPASAGGKFRAGGAALVVLIVVCSPYWGVVAYSGSEVPFAAGLACWGLVAVGGPAGGAIRLRRLLAGCACAGLGPLLRPEMLFLSVCLGPLLFFRWVNTPWPFRRKLAAFAAGMLLAVGPGAGWLLYTVRHFGTGLPNALGAGAAAPDASVPGGLFAGFAVGCPWVLAGCLGLAAWGGLRRAGRSEVSGYAVRHAMYPSGWVPFFWAFFVATFYLGTHTAIHADEVMLTLPALTVSLWVSLSRLWPRIARWSGPVVVIYGLAMSMLFTWPALRTDRERGRNYAALAGQVQRLPDAARVALMPVGEVLFLSGHPVADFGGTLDPGALAFRWDAGDDRRVWWAHEEGARYMVLDHAPEPGSRPVWTGNLPSRAGRSLPGQVQGFDRLTLWKLPPSPTLPAPTVLPDHVD